MHTMAKIVSLPGAVLLAFSMTACSLYFEGDNPPPPPPPAPWIDAGPAPWIDAGWPSLPPPPPPPAEISVPIPAPLRGGQAAFLEVIRSHTNRPAEQEIVPIPADASALTIPSNGAGHLSLSLYTQQGELIDATVFYGACPLFALAKSQRILQVPVEYPTIQAAIDAANTTDIVYVHPGTYREHIRMRSGIRLIGAGASRTILDGGGQDRHIIDFTGAQNVVVRGFFLHHVGPGETCTRPTSTPLDCSGDWHPAAVYGDGHRFDAPYECPASSIVLTHNIIEGSATGVMLYFHVPAAIRNNIFIDNVDAVAANHLNNHALIMSNTFIGNNYTAIAEDGYLDILNNVITSSPVGILYDYESARPNDHTCNLFHFIQDPGAYVPIGQYGNLELDPSFRDPIAGDYRIGEGSEAAGIGCYPAGTLEVGSASLDPGAFGGAGGNWFQQELSVEDVARLYGL